MTLLERLRTVYRAVEQFAELMEHDPVEDLRRRVAELEGCSDRFMHRASGTADKPRAP